jgi:hypothetical protein
MASINVRKSANGVFLVTVYRDRDEDMGLGGRGTEEHAFLTLPKLMKFVKQFYVEQTAPVEVVIDA